MKVGICHHYSLSYYAGGEKFIINLAQSLTHLGFQVGIYALPIARKNDLGALKLPIGIDYEEKWYNTVDADVAYFVYAPLTSRLFRCSCPKIASIHAFALAPELQNKEAIPKNPVKFFSIHGFVPSIAYYSRFLSDLELSDFDAFHMINPSMNVKHQRIFSIPLWVDTDVYKPTRDKNDQFTVLFVGRRSWKKGSDIFLRTAEVMKRIDSNIRFVAVGRRESEGSNDLIEEAGFIHGIELRDVYSSAHVVVAPSRVDVCSLVLLESQSCGTPVIASDIVAHRLPNLQLTFASTVEETVKAIQSLRDLWEKNPEEYCALATKVRSNVTKFYCSKALLPRFRDMLVAVCTGQYSQLHKHQKVEKIALPQSAST